MRRYEKPGRLDQVGFLSDYTTVQGKLGIPEIYQAGLCTSR